MKRALLVAAALLAAGCLAQPVSPTPDAPSPTPASPTPTSPTPGETDVSEGGALVDANARFARDAFRAMSAENPRENLVVSPYSIATALQMLYGGSAGTTQRAMVAALRLGDAVPTLDAQARALLLNLTSENENLTLRIGNSVWIDAAFAPDVEPAFVERADESYRAEARTRDFRDAATVDEVNAWASDATDGEIPRVIEEIASDEIMFLLNAVYFKGGWSVPFNETCTHEAPFTREDGSVVQVPMMCGGAGYGYASSPDGTTVRLPYGDGRFAMYVVLPPAGVPLDAFVEGWSGRLHAAPHPDVQLQMPRLELATRSYDLKPALASMGMGVAFTDQADFTRIAERLYVSRVVHDAILEVDEKGSVGAAVTTIGVAVTSYTPPVEVTLDRPFLVGIQDDETGTILFLGKVHDPTAR